MKHWTLEKYLEICNQFKLGELPTESQHPLTSQLSTLALNDLASALETLHQVDVQALHAIEVQIDPLEELSKTIKKVIAQEGKIFISGCGATGRLALAIEFLWREAHQNSEMADRLCGFMAGGDVALIRSIENFEDNPEYGVKQLRELGFTEKDLLIAVTEGGETPFVIGTVQYAARHSTHSPYFLYCNPDHILAKVAQRSREVIENQAIKKIYFPTGPMALSGSTRMQATTVQMLSICLALFDGGNIQQAFTHFQKLLTFNPPSTFLGPLIISEAQTYLNGDYVQYRTGSLGLTVLTDTTERSPTFSLTPFENIHALDPRKLSLCYLTLTTGVTTKKAWDNLLLRKPRFLEWDDTIELTGKARAYGFDFSLEGEGKRRHRIGNHKLYNFEIDCTDQKLVFSFNQHHHSIQIKGVPSYQVHLLLKTMLNIHSTLVMGRLHRYEKNVMTWVKPSNLKLIDRSLRYVMYLRQQNKLKELPYQELAHALFQFLPSHTEGESIVQKVYNAVKNRS